MKLLFVCMGNICRSPTAHAVMQHKIEQRGLADRMQVESAGTHAYHVGEQSDPRSRAKAAERGIDMESIRAQKISVSDHDTFDSIYAMDRENLELIKLNAPENGRATVTLFLDAARAQGLTDRAEVPDPYYGGGSGFDDVFDLVDLGCEAILNEVLA